ncbi:FemAB family PEP-CTERM system-associated protein [Desulfonema limicola]|uniref:FemAB family PEP-CTERM system-associated protein n=1 Tax=Desulfonema limicola TaxID=45656 RepID=A0A975B5E4_9BACT|nr:FemAB family XrtA/PEP-CTERM system-associated protein [Desulfonema limicola]QTA79099.1 FemAB family PEP-CTERM system-associated protein [Desulfonema limicola]
MKYLFNKKITVHEMNFKDSSYWDHYVKNHGQSTLYHLFKWRHIIEKTYGHKTYCLAAADNNKSYPVRGILPLVHLKHFIFGNKLISMPFFDLGGILADDEKAEKVLIDKAVTLARHLNVDQVELRHITPLSIDSGLQEYQYRLQTVSSKVRMLLKLPNCSETLMNSFKAKLRSQIKRPLKAGFYSKIGGKELLDDFYNVFSVNMRDLGSPVHSKSLIKNILIEFPGNAKIVMVYKEQQPAACSFITGFKDTLSNPWASALREYSRFSPNMLLYWTMLDYACDNGYNYFDFGRSSPGEGTYKFKQQWGARPIALNWQYIVLKNETKNLSSDDKSRFDQAIEYWKKLPVCLTKIIGPVIRKNIGL